MSKEQPDNYHESAAYLKKKKELQLAFEQLCQHPLIREYFLPIKFKIEDTPITSSGFAAMVGEYVMVSPNILEDFSLSELRFIMAHEIGHYMALDRLTPHKKIRALHEHHELRADKIAAILTQDASSGISALQRTIDKSVEIKQQDPEFAHMQRDEIVQIIEQERAEKGKSSLKKRIENIQRIEKQLNDHGIEKLESWMREEIDDIYNNSWPERSRFLNIMNQNRGGNER